MFNVKNAEKPLVYIKRNFKKLYIPYIIYNSLFIMIHNLPLKYNLYYKNAINWYSISDFIYQELNILLFSSNERLAGATWFIPVLFLSNILLVLILAVSKKFICKKLQFYFEIFCVSINLIIGYNTNIRFKLSIAMVALFFNYCGYIYIKNID